MKRFFRIASYFLFIGITNIIVPIVAQAAPLILATKPLAVTTSNPIKPNILFVLDNSGSMSWTHMPDKVQDFVGAYGYQSEQCNGVYYDPTITYKPPIYADETSYVNAVFTAARDDGYDTSTTARNLNSEFMGNRFEPAVANTTYSGFGSYITTPLGASGAVYYKYTGAVTDKNYENTASPFYTECNIALGGAALFEKRRLATTITAPFIVNSATGVAAPTATITVTGTSTSTVVSTVFVNGTQINTFGATTAANTNNAVATNLAAKIGSTFNTAGYKATASLNVITITGPAGAAGFTPIVNKSSGNAGFSPITAFNGNTVNLTVNGVALMSSPAVIVNNNTTTTAANIAAKITSNGFSATVSGNIVTITAPASAINYLPIASLTGGGGLTFDTDVFPDNAAAKLTNFANWYSYYRTRMLTMKTSAGLAFGDLDDAYRVGFMQINQNTATSGTAASSSVLVNNNTFSSASRTDWYSKLYNAIPRNGTPLRTALSVAGKYYAGNIGTDPVQYSCQQNFTILSTDGYWNGGAGSKLDGSAVGNQDGADIRPYNDGFVNGTEVTTQYQRQVYQTTATKIGGGNNCDSGKKRTINTTQTQSCTVTTPTAGVAGPENCSAWNSSSVAYYSPYTSNKSSCVASPVVPNPATTARVSTSSSSSDVTISAGTSDTLADVAEYYYNTDLRPGSCALCEDNVFKSATDSNAQQHMTTFTLGLGASGRMKYMAGYAKAGTSTDYDAVKNGVAATGSLCTWQAAGSTCTWPTPASDQVENIDDLWHAAVNGRGTYFSADNPDTLASGLTSALKGIDAKKGAAAAAATSTLNPVAGNNDAFVASYTNNEWRGNLESRSINTQTGLVTESATWCVENVPAGTCKVNGLATAPVAQTTGGTTIYNCETPVASTTSCSVGVKGKSGDLTTGGDFCKVQMAQACTGTMNTKVSLSSDTRLIYTANSSNLPTTGKVAGTELIPFDATYATANPSNFDSAKLVGLTQWSTFDSIQQGNAVGANMVNYLRGQYTYEDRASNADIDKLFRKRDAILGDALESQPAFIGKPVFSYPYTAYDLFKADNASRAGAVYMGTNDGMMHAFASATGVETWAYIPSMVIPNMWKLADFDYSNRHTNFVNGSAITTDVCTNPCAAKTDWKTILVAGLNGGGRGYYALDITIPTSPKLLWEFTTAAGLGKIKDDDVGYSYGQPVITRKNDGTWVVMVTSGYNNISPGDGGGHLFVLNALTGQIISKVSTGVGSTTTPSGLAKIAAYNTEPPGNAAGYTYGGDLFGNLWRFNINDCGTGTPSTCTFMKFAKLYANSTATDSSTPTANDQPITTTPVLGKVGGKRVIFIGTGLYLQDTDLNITQQQSQYAIQDDNATSTFVNPRNTLTARTLTTNTTNGTRSVTSAATTADFTRGWYVDWPPSGSKERVNIDAKLVQGVLIVPSIVPSSTACSPGGTGWLNFFDYKNGGAISAGIVSAKYDSAIVGVNVLFIDGEPVVEVVTSTNPTPQIDPDIQFPPVEGNFAGKRSLWRELTQ